MCNALAHVRFTPKKRTCAVQLVMSAKCQKRTYAAKKHSFDHLVGAGEQRRGDCKAERLGGLEIDGQVEFGRLDNRQVGRFGTPKNAPDVVASLAKRSSKVGPITYEPTGSDILARIIDRGQ